MAEIEIIVDDDTNVIVNGSAGLSPADIIEIAPIIGPQGIQGIQGIQGPSGTLSLGTVATGAAGTPVSITNTGTASAGIFNFTIPQGLKGDTGTLSLGTVTTGAAGTNALITNTGTPTAGVFNFTIPKGDKGDTGTINLGTVNTGAPGTSVSITNTGSLTNAIFNFTIPRGDKGATGTMSVGTVTTGAAGSAAAITNTGTPEAGIFNFTIPQGIQGIPGSKWYTGAGVPANGSYAVGDWYLNTTNSDVYEKTAAAVWTLRTNIKGATGTLSVGTVTTGAAGSAVTITNTGTATAAILNFSIPQGIQGIQGIQGVKGDQGIQGPQGIQGIQGNSGTLAVGSVTTGAVGSNATVTNTGTAQAAVLNFTLPRGAGVQTGGTTGQYLRKSSNADFDTAWVDIPAPTNMATVDTAQSITAVKTFTVAPVFPDASIPVVDVIGLQAALDSKYGVNSSPTFNTVNVGSATVGSTNRINFVNPGIGGVQEFIFTRATDSAGMRVSEPVGDQILYQFYMSDNPDSGDTFSWYYTDHQGGNWEPIRIEAMTNTFRAAHNYFYGNIQHIASNWYSGNAGVPNQVTKTGTGTQTVTPNVNAFSGTSTVYWVRIDGVGTPNTFAWGTGSPVSTAVATGVPITGGAQTLNQGVTVTFSATTGGVVGDQFVFRANSGGVLNTGRVNATSLYEGANRVYSATTGMATTVPAATTYGLASAVGTGTLWARNDHTHGTPPAQTISVSGAGITATPSGVNYTLANTGVTSLVAGSNVTVSAATGAVTIGVAAAPTFTGALSAASLLEGAVRVYSPNNPQPMTGYATTAEVDSRINAIIDAAPGTLDTLNELAAALGDDPNFAATITANVNSRALDTAVVHLAGTETVTGAKTFSALGTFAGDISVRPGTALATITLADGTITKASGSGFTFNSSINATTQVLEAGVRVYGPNNANLAGTVATANTYGLAAVLGTGTAFARNDHHHGTPPAQTLTAGTGITVTPSGVNYTVTNAGVTSIVAGTNATVSGATGAVTVGVAANPVFSSATDGMIHMSGGAADSTTWLYGSIAGVQKFRLNRDGLVRATAVNVYSGGDVLSGTNTASISSAGVITGTTIMEGANRVYSAANPPPYPAAPVSSVAGRTGAVVLTNTDIADSMSLSTAQTAAGAKTFSGMLRAQGAVSETAAGVSRLDLGVAGGSPRIIFDENAVAIWEIDSSSGVFRWYNPGAVKMTLTTGGVLDVTSEIREAGSRVYSARNAPPKGIPFHVGGTVGTGLKPVKFIAPGPMTLRAARAWIDTQAANGTSWQIYVNGAAVSGAAYVMAAAGTLYTNDFADVNINAGDRVQLFINAADATATELSVTIEAVNR